MLCSSAAACRCGRSTRSSNGSVLVFIGSGRESSAEQSIITSIAGSSPVVTQTHVDSAASTETTLAGTHTGRKKTRGESHALRYPLSSSYGGGPCWRRASFLRSRVRGYGFKIHTRCSV